MPLIQGGPPEWIWERPPEALRCAVVPARRPGGEAAYELRVTCGLDIMRLQFLTAGELKALAEAAAAPPG